MSKYGFNLAEWKKAKNSAKKILVEVVKSQGIISYSELANHLPVDIEPHEYGFHELLGEISEEEFNAGRGMLSALVVHKDGNKRPGNGFFTWAEQLGYEFDDIDIFWISELKRVYAAHTE